MTTRTQRLIQEMEAFTLQQLNRLHETSVEMSEAQRLTNPAVSVGHAPHAVGKRKPNLEQLESRLQGPKLSRGRRAF